MPDHSLDQFEVSVGRGVGVCQNVLRVEEVQALVLHGPGVEVGHGHDHEPLEVELEAKAPFIPLHGSPQALKCKVGP